MLQAIKHVDGRVLWANLHLLFWLSLIPFATSWMGASKFSTWPVALYGIVLLLAGLAYFVLARILIIIHGKDSPVAIALGRDDKGKISVVLYSLAIPLAFVSTWLSCLLYILVALMWLIPDQRIEKTLTP